MSDEQRLVLAIEGKTWGKGGLNVSHIRKIVKERGFKNYSKLKRVELIALLSSEPPPKSKERKTKEKVVDAERYVDLDALPELKEGYTLPLVVCMQRLKGEIVQDADVYIGRKMSMGGWKLEQSKWYNLFTKRKTGSPLEACKQYDNWLHKHEDGKALMDDLKELDGATLGCWCKPKLNTKGVRVKTKNPCNCHGDVLIKAFAEKFKRDEE
uniref:DUF4326 domain-containing protein n=1 Tax=Pithovirus LCDPAC01 TaxID=2506600 RepID=A0A481YNT8_9VIRU|nr:MAG: protein of unknown function DUF4326 [Pithovirus LCDPAC01]